VIVAVVLAGWSGGDDVAPDAAPPDAELPDLAAEWTGDFVWTIGAGGEGAVVRIDGEIRGELELHFDGEAAARERTVLVENVVDGVVASSYVLTGNCREDCGPYTAWLRWDSLCAYASGELRLQGSGCEGPNAWCSGDAWCWGPCGPHLVGLGCPDDERCGIDRVDAVPTHGWLECVAIGPRADGETCTIDAAGIDDCGAQLYCVEGVCRPQCWIEEGCEAPATCVHLDGMSPNVKACLPPT
jgi:hypothetical protein